MVLYRVLIWSRYLKKEGAKNLNRIQRLIAIRVIWTYRTILYYRAEVALLPTGMVPFTLIAQADDKIFQSVQTSPVE